jgi:membrane protein implicated in regulation of membrane protease activity
LFGSGPGREKQRGLICGGPVRRLIPVKGGLMKPATLVATIFLAVVALLHVVRLMFQVELSVNGAPVPMWLSLIGFLFTGGLAVWMWRENRPRKTAMSPPEAERYSVAGLEDMIYELHPEIVQHAMNLSVAFDAAQNAYVLKFSRGGRELNTFLNKEDADECMGGNRCIHLGVQIAQFLDDFEHLSVPPKAAE